MQSVDLSGLNKLDTDLDIILREVPQACRELHEKISEAMKQEVDVQIENSGLNDSRGRIKDWQEPHVGSGGGYAAVRAEKGATGANSPGAITNYLENGHRTRTSGGNAKRARAGRAKVAHVNGYHFYQAARSNVEVKAIAEAEKYVDEMRKKLEG